jgi:phage baseplate assembly protein gpV
MDEFKWCTGLVTEWKPGYVKVKLPTYDDVMTDWIQVIKLDAVGMDINVPFETDTQVQVIIDKYNRIGICLGATSNEVDTPDPAAAADKYRVLFKDNSYFEYDKSAHVLKVKLADNGSELHVTVGSDIDVDAKNGEIDVSVKNKVKVNITDSGGEVDLTVGSSTVVIKNNLIEFNGGSNNGLVKVAALVTKLNNLENDLNNLKTVFTSWTPVPNDGGAALKAGVTTYAAASLTPTVQANLEDVKVKH